MTKPKRRVFLQGVSLFLLLAIAAFVKVDYTETNDIKKSSIIKKWESNVTTKSIVHDDKTVQAGSERSISIPPSKMELNYYQMWDHETSTIDVPEKYQNPFNMLVVDDETGNERRALTSLEILHNVLHGPKYRAEFEAAEAFVNGNSTVVPKCLRADIGATQELANRVVRERNESRNAASSANTTKRKLKGKGKEKEKPRFQLPLPILNVGYPKAGSSTLHDFFKCLEMESRHGQEGEAMFKRLAEGKEIFKRQTFSKKADAYLQLDTNFKGGFYPQIQLLDELHETDPNSTLIINFRPIHDWIASISNWNAMRNRMSAFLMPGLVLTEIQRKYAKDVLEGIREPQTRLSEKLKLSEVQLAKWVCGHALHIREYASEYPSHSLIELDLYDTNGTTSLLHDLFQVDADDHWESLREDGVELPEQPKQCWGHSNKNPKNIEQKTDNAELQNDGRKKKQSNKNQKKKEQTTDNAELQNDGRKKKQSNKNQKKKELTTDNTELQNDGRKEKREETKDKTKGKMKAKMKAKRKYNITS